jgi:endonuclease III-like uncharacterized protein
MQKNLLQKPEEKRPHGRHSLAWEDNIKMDLKGIGSETVDWILVIH